MSDETYLLDRSSNLWPLRSIACFAKINHDHNNLSIPNCTHTSTDWARHSWAWRWCTPPWHQQAERRTCVCYDGQGNSGLRSVCKGKRILLHRRPYNKLWKEEKTTYAGFKTTPTLNKGEKAISVPNSVIPHQQTKRLCQGGKPTMGVNVGVGVEVLGCLAAAFPTPVPAAATAAPSTIPSMFISSKSSPQLLENEQGWDRWWCSCKQQQKQEQQQPPSGIAACSIISRRGWVWVTKTCVRCV